MIAEFLTGVIVGVLIGLAMAPVLREWMYLRTAKDFEIRHRGRSRVSEQLHLRQRGRR